MGLGKDNREGRAMKRILFIEDDVTYSQLMSWILKEHNFEVITVGTVEAAISAIKEVDFDCWVVDYWLPGLTNGIEFIQQARKLGYKTGCLIITCLLPYEIDSKIDGLDIWSVVEKGNISDESFITKIEEAIRFTELVREV